MPDITETLFTEHQDYTDRLRRLEEIGRRGPSDQRRELLDDLLPELRAHVAGEREVVLPAIVHSLSDGPEMAATETEVFDEVDDDLSTLETTSSDDPGHEEALTRLVEHLREHLGRWDEQILPEWRDALGTDHREELGDAYERAKAERADIGSARG